MCGIIGFIGKNTPENMEKLTKLFIESGYRGVHATGYSVLTKDGIQTVKEPLPAKDFLEKHPMKFDEDVVCLIGHTRYSTSDLEFNQPLTLGSFKAMAVNGVIDQSDPSTWAAKYNSEFSTRNDAEILLNQSGYHEVLDLFDVRGSYAFVELTKDKLRFGRNAYRPLWYTNAVNEIWVASTRDILERAGFHRDQIWQCIPHETYTARFEHCLDKPDIAVKLGSKHRVFDMYDQQPENPEYKHLICNFYAN